LYSPPNIIMVIESRRMRLAEHVALMGEMRSTLGIHRRRLEDNIKMGLKEIEHRYVNWICASRNRNQGRAKYRF
jgi:hypothetical protein